VLNQWKQNRAKIGSQCSWLSLKIATLDEKISSLNKVHTSMRTNRAIRNQTFDDTSKKQTHSLSSSSELTSTTEAAHCGCSRTRPFINKQVHKYIQKPKTENHKASNGYQCRCVNGYSSCRLCLERSKQDGNTSRFLVEMCDQNFHAVLSQKNGINISS